MITSFTLHDTQSILHDKIKMLTSQWMLHRTIKFHYTLCYTSPNKDKSFSNSYYIKWRHNFANLLRDAYVTITTWCNTSYQLVYHPCISDLLLCSGKLSSEKFREFVAICESFSVKFGDLALFGSPASNTRKFSLRKSYFPPVCESFLPRKFLTIQY